MQKKTIALMTYAIDGRQAKGTALYARKLTEGLLREYGDEFEFTLVHYEKSDDPIYRMGAKEILFPHLAWNLPYGSRFLRFLLFCWRNRKESFDIVHWFQPRVYPFFWLIPARRIVITAHAAGDITAPRSFRSFSRAVFNATLLLANKKVDVLLAVSEYARKEIITEYRADPDRVVVTYNGGGEVYQPLPKDECASFVERYSLRPPYILSVARFQPHKNVERLVDAYSIFRQEHPSLNHSLVLVGSPVKGYSAVEDAINSSAYKDDIQVVPYVAEEDMNQLYACADLFVFISVNEGFGLPVVEAMASGTPVVTATSTSLPEVVGGAALCVDPYNTEKVAFALAEVLLSKELRQDLIRQGLLRAKSFSWGITVGKTVEIYRTLI